MPVKLERRLQREAREHGYKRGSERYNAYVYGTMNKLGILSHNHAGNLGPDRLLKRADYKPTVDHVHGAHIAVVVALLFVVYWYFFRGGQGTVYSNSGRKNGDGASTYVSVNSVSGWVATQYNSLGATAGALNGESN